MNIGYIRAEYVLPEIGGATDALIDLIVRQTIIDFCRETRIYTHKLSPISLTAGVSDYDLTPPTDTQIVGINHVWLNENLLTPLTVPDVDIARLKFFAAGRPSYYTFAMPATISLYPTPEQNMSNALSARVALAPSLSATEIPDWLGSRYLSAIAAGTKARLMLMAKKPWSNPDLAKVYMAEYTSARTNARIEASRSFAMAPLMMQL